MSELEEIRKKRLQELQEQQFEAQQRQQEIGQQLLALENYIKPKLTKKALVRFGNIKTAHPQIAVQLMIIISELIKNNKVEMLDDEMLKKILMQIQSAKKEIKIKRK